MRTPVNTMTETLAPYRDQELEKEIIDSLIESALTDSDPHRTTIPF